MMERCRPDDRITIHRCQRVSGLWSKATAPSQPRSNKDGCTAEPHVRNETPVSRSKSIRRLCDTFPATTTWFFLLSFSLARFFFVVVILYFPQSYLCVNMHFALWFYWEAFQSSDVVVNTTTSLILAHKLYLVSKIGSRQILQRKVISRNILCIRRRKKEYFSFYFETGGNTRSHGLFI